MSKSSIAYLIICFCLYISTKTNGQNYSQKELRRFDDLFFKAEKALYEEDFDLALKGYEVLMTSGLNYGNSLYFNAELCSLLTDYQSKPIRSFLSYEQEMKAKDKFYYYWKGRVLLRKYQMDSAKKAFVQFLDTDKYLSEEIREEAKKWIHWSENAKVLMSEPDSISLNLLKDLNSDFVELSPVYFKDSDEMIFLSNKDTWNEDFRVYRAKKEASNKWSTPELINSLGRFSRENAHIQLVSDQKKLYHYKNDDKGGGIYYSEYSEETKEWSASIKLDRGNQIANLGPRFYINKGQNRVIFAKNMGTKKKPNLDLVETIRNPATGKWSKPYSISASINSDFNEDAPYLSTDGFTLYFTSDGHDSMGGYDIFKSELDRTTMTWSKPVNLGYPINSPDNETQFKINDDGKGGHFTSNRLNTRDYDLFFFWETDRVQMKGRVIDTLTQELITNVNIYFKPLNYQDMHFMSAVDDQGQYDTEINTKETYIVELDHLSQRIAIDTFEIGTIYNLNATIEREFYFSRDLLPPAFVATNLKRLPIAVDKRYKAEGPETLDRLGTKFRRSNYATLRNIYFDFGAYELKYQSEETLHTIRQFLKEKESISVEIAGHTDNIGAENINESLAYNRANAVKTWLIDNGISSGRMIARGYGASKPLASNDDELDGRELNRRIEIIIQE